MDPVTQGNGLVDILDIRRDPDHIDRTFVHWLEFLFQNTMRIDHNANFYIGFDAVDDLADLIVIAIFPGTEFFRVSNLTAAAITHLHIIHARITDRLINSADEFIREIVIVN